MEEIQCPEVAYNKIINSRIYDIIKERRERVKDLILMNDFSSSKDVFNKTRSYLSDNNQKISERSRLYKNIINFENDLDDSPLYMNSDSFREMFMKNPSFFAYSILGEILFNYKNFGFPSMKSLEEAVTSFCIGERIHNISNNNGERVWRNKGMKNVISQNIHGDLWAGQIDLSDRLLKEKDLFGEYEKFDTVRRIEHPIGIYGYQDWSSFLYSVLLYSREIGKDKIPEITNWKDVLREVGSVGTNTAECEFGGSHFGFDYLFGNKIFNDKEKLEGFPLHVSGRSGDFFYLPYVKQGKLLYFVTDKDGEIKFENAFLEGDRFRKIVEYNSSDLPDLLKANYRLFARDRSLLPVIMDHFISEKSIP